MSEAPNPSNRWSTPTLDGNASMPLGPGDAPTVAAGAQDGAPGGAVAVARYPDYADAQRAVDRLADSRFPVEQTAIVGTDLTLVENVLGRLTTGRAALAGAGTGAWFGLFIGLLFGIFTVGNWLAVIVAGLVIGAVWGGIFGAIAHAMTGGRRDYTSTSMLRAQQYAVMVQAPLADQARQVLGLRPGSQPA